MERFPVFAACVPVEPSSNTFLRNSEVRSDFVLNCLEWRTAIRVFGNQMRAFVPRDPLRISVFGFLLRCAHFLNKLVVNAPVVLLTEEIRDYDYIVVLYLLVKYWSIWSNYDTHFRSHKGWRWIEGFSVATSACVFLCFPLFLRVQFSRVIFNLR